MSKFNFKKLSVLAVLSTATFSMIVTPAFAKVTVTNSTFNEVVVNKATEIEFDNKVNVSKILFNTSDVTVIGLPSTTNIQVGEHVDTEKIGGLSKEQKDKAKRVVPAITNQVVAPVISKVEKITITSKAKGSVAKSVKLDLPNAGGNSYKILKQNQVFDTPNKGDKAPIKAVAYISGDDITDAQANEYVGVYEVDGSDKIVKFVSVQLEAKDIKAAPVVAPIISGHKVEAGSATGTTKVTYTVGNGNSLKYKLEDKAFTIPNVGDVLSGGTGYTSGQDIKAEANKYLGLYEVDGSDNIVKFVSVQLEAKDIKAAPVVAPTISGHNVEAGSASGTTKVTYTVGNGNSLKYKLADKAFTTPHVGEALSGGEQDYTSGGDIKAEANKYLGLYEVDGSDNIVKFVSVQLKAGDIKAAPVAVPTISNHKVEVGSATGTTKVTYTVGNGNSLKYKLEDKAFTTPHVGEALSGGEQDYTSGGDITAEANKYLGLYEVDGSNNIVKFVSVQLEAGNIKAAPVAVPTISNHKVEAGSAPGTTKVTYTVGKGNSLKYKLADNAFTPPHVGEALPGGEQDYTSGNDIPAEANKYLGLYEVDGSNHIVKFVSVQLKAKDIKAAPVVAPTISGQVVAEGSATGTTKVTYTVGNGNSLKYKLADHAFTTPNVGEALPGGEQDYTSGNDIPAEANKYLGLYEVDGSNNIVKFVSVQLKAKDIKVAPIAVPTISGHKVEAGSAPETTKVTYTTGEGNSLEYKLADDAFTIPNVGDVLSGGTGYISGENIPAEANKYLGLYEVDGSNNIVKFVSVQLKAKDIKATPVDAISGHKVAEGSASGATKVTYTVGEGNSLKYKLAGNAFTTPNVGEALPGGEQDYTSGNDIPVKAGQHLGLYEVDGSKNIVKFVSVQLEAKDIKATPVDAISGHKVAEGSASGATKVTYTTGEGNSLKYKLAGNAFTPPNVGEALPGGEQDYTSGNDIPVKAGQHLGLYEVDGSKNIVKFVSVQLEAKNIKATPVVAISGHKVAEGSASGTTKVTYTVGTGNSLKYKLADNAFTPPNVGDVLPGGEQDYTSGENITAEANKHLGLYEVDGSNNIVKFVSIQLEAGNISE
ncbi:hypothetical protein C4A75_18765 [Brevibacillus laterosporus]|uniref:hypothetical protein n=1 Tax=Brevibacillus laterosporus TaxID=1465 RepID=UPI000CE2D725|nr:hypothetical protein [Brevibacillus laterosporus]PPA82547.1 hypothetical protein C4A75_18765 [Brevibacillus laterosporus]